MRPWLAAAVAGLLLGCGGGGGPESTLPPAPVGNLYRVVLATGPSTLIQASFDGDSLRLERSLQLDPDPGIEDDGRVLLSSIGPGDTLFFRLPGEESFRLLSLESGESTEGPSSPTGTGWGAWLATAQGRVLAVTDLEESGEQRKVLLRVDRTTGAVDTVDIAGCPRVGDLSLDPTDASTALLSCPDRDLLLRVDLEAPAVPLRIGVRPGEEGPQAEASLEPSSSPERRRCAPTAIRVKDGRIYTACSEDARLLVMDLASGSFLAEYYLGGAPSGLELTPDGALLVTLLGSIGAVEFLDLTNGIGMGSARTSASEAHTVAIAPDGRYAFLTSGDATAGTGALEVFDLATLRRVAGLDFTRPAGDILFWKLLGTDDASTR